MVCYKILLCRFEMKLNSSMSNFATNDFIVTLPLMKASFLNNFFCSRESIEKRSSKDLELILLNSGAIKLFGIVMCLWFYNITKVQGFYKINVIVF